MRRGARLAAGSILPLLAIQGFPVPASGLNPSPSVPLEKFSRCRLEPRRVARDRGYIGNMLQPVFESLRTNVILDMRSINSYENDLSSALDRELGTWTGWNILAFLLPAMRQPEFTILSGPETAGSIAVSVDRPPKAPATVKRLYLLTIPE